MESNSDFEMASIPTKLMIPVFFNLILGCLRPLEAEMLLVYRDNRRYRDTCKRFFDDNSNMESNSDLKMASVRTYLMIPVFFNLIFWYQRSSESQMLYRDNP